MKFKAFLAAAALLASQSFAIVGIGGHYAPGFGTKMNGMSAPAPVTDDGSVLVKHEGFSGTMQGFGFKAWIDILPFIDIEGTFNIQFGSYDASLYIINDPVSYITSGSKLEPGTEPDLSLYKEVPLKLELGGVPFAEANPKFVHMSGDLTITYPITFIPIIRPYIGGGVTYNLNTFILNQSFTSTVVGSAYKTMAAAMQEELNGILADPAAAAAMDPEQYGKKFADKLQDKVVDNLKDAALEEGLTKSIGGHVMVGVRAKLPIIPIAAYANFKYYFGGDYPTEIDAGNMTVEIGGGFAL